MNKLSLKSLRLIKKYINLTPLVSSAWLSGLGKKKIFLKKECNQITKSFKVRGAMNKLLSLNKEKEIITASTGNHAIGVAYGLEKLDLKGRIFVPENISSTKIEKLESYNKKNNLELIYYGNDCEKTESYARKVALLEEIPYISPYNDLEIIIGQSTIGVEIENQLSSKFLNSMCVLIPVGGGGLISGIGSYLKSVNENIKIIGCLPQNSPVMYESIKAGKIVEIPILDSISDGTCGGIEEDSITFDYCRKFVDEYIIVDEKEIANAMNLLFEHENLVVEGSGAVSVAGFLKEQENLEEKNVVLVLSGGNINFETFQKNIANFHYLFPSSSL